MKYHIQTLGCQMNVADSQRLASALEQLGYEPIEPNGDPDSADVHVINTCVVRQQAEDKAWGRLQQLRKLKEKNPNIVIGLMGCLVGVKDPLRLRKQVPFVDVFIPPSEIEPMTAFLQDRNIEADVVTLEVAKRARLNAAMDEMAPEQAELVLPAHERGTLVSAHVPVVYGCSHACTFCIIPFRRGIERSRPVGEIVREVRSLAQQGVKEITLLGQIVDRYGKDIPDGPNLAQLLRVVHQVAEEEDLYRIRFLTSHPNWMTDELLETVAELPRVMPHIEVPIQAGNDLVLENMKRGYTQQQYRDLIAKIRRIIPNVAIHTDIIVGFPGETHEQFMDTYQVLADLKLDKAHLAMYSPRPGTVSERRMQDDVPKEEKKQRHKMLEELQAQVQAEINAPYLGQTVEILVEDLHKGKWRGRTPQNKLVFFEDNSRNWKGRLVNVEVVWTGPYSMQARLPKTEADQADATGIPTFDPTLEIIPLATS
ncbi:MAG: tRNA (N6-isopentenyl adenosine(37)-C2)-methylthiotransferase MiaB [Phototrophicales bacterium]|nr:MAG: tRNA (N6-isopentenyl adenosine(37)-C2)-methylthiotransferase MiaB [Phototrophicales bacterium]